MTIVVIGWLRDFTNQSIISITQVIKKFEIHPLILNIIRMGSLSFCYIISVITRQTLKMMKLPLGYLQTTIFIQSNIFFLFNVRSIHSIIENYRDFSEIFSFTVFIIVITQSVARTNMSRAYQFNVISRLILWIISYYIISSLSFYRHLRIKRVT